jgi:hypothetical protein
LAQEKEEEENGEVLQNTSSPVKSSSFRPLSAAKNPSEKDSPVRKKSRKTKSNKKEKKAEKSRDRKEKRKKSGKRKRKSAASDAEESGLSSDEKFLGSLSEPGRHL